jgi:hypothetical protein
MGVLDIPWQSWLTALSMLAVVLAPIVLLARHEAAKARRFTAKLAASAAAFDEYMRRTWRSTEVYSLPNDEPARADMVRALDRTRGLFGGLSVDDVHRVCDFAEDIKLRRRYGV